MTFSQYNIFCPMIAANIINCCMIVCVCNKYLPGSFITPSRRSGEYYKKIFIINSVKSGKAAANITYKIITDDYIPT